MMPGPDEYFKCPKCGQIVSRGSLMSGNTFDAVLYSDGNQIAPMLPEFPFFIKCKNCNTFFWLKQNNEVKKYKFPKKPKENESIKEAEFLTIDEYLEAINLNIYLDNKEHKYIRMKLWWAYNDKLRENSNNEYSEAEYKVYENNCKELIKLLDKEDINEKLMIAELLRNIGKFEDCLEILKTIDDENINWVKEIFTKECVKNNKKLVILRE